MPFSDEELAQMIPVLEDINTKLKTLIEGRRELAAMMAESHRTLDRIELRLDRFSARIDSFGSRRPTSK